MAFNPRQIFPNDLNENRAIGINLPFNGAGVFTSNYQTRNAIKNNLINYFKIDTEVIKNSEEIDQIGNENFES